MTLSSEGRNPKLRHDSTDFDLELDSKRIERADTSNHVVVALCEYRGDWPALCEICGCATGSTRANHVYVAKLIEIIC